MLKPLLLALALSFAANAEPVPPEAAPKTEGSSVKKPLGAVIAGAGAVTLGISYGGAIATAAVYGVLVTPFLAAFKVRIPTDPFLLFVPVFGPLQIVHNDNLDHGTRELCYLDAAAQGVGILMIVGGLALAASSSAPDSRAVAPILMPNGAGFAARF